MMNLRRIKYPIGRQNFSKLIEDGCLYVDKTEYIHRLTNAYKYVFLGRPRRFGKSLLISTIEAYFRGERHLFRGLAIDNLAPEPWDKYPVVHFDFSGEDYSSGDVLHRALSSYLGRYETELAIEKPEGTASARFRCIMECLYQRTGKGVVVLIDEYDNPITSATGNAKLQDELRNILYGFYSALKQMDRYIHFCMLTGVTKYGKMSVFSGLNNLKDISFLDSYAGICGITEDELHRDFHQGVGELAATLGLDTREAYRLLKASYDGYHFSDCMLDVYNPFSILNALADCKIGNYWFDTGTPSLLIKSLKDLDIDIRKLNGSEASMERLGNISSFIVNPLALFYQTGYLTIKSYDPIERLYVLGFPNREVETGFMNYLLPAYTHNYDSETIVSDMRRSLRNGETEDFIRQLTSYLADIPYDLRKNIAKYENYYHTIFYAVFSLIGVDTTAEYHTSQGSIDLVIRTKQFLYIIELKINGTADDAIAQIKRNGYAAPFIKEKREIILIGLGFSKLSHTIDSWSVADG